ncbi:hypothetical protein CsSME_00050735 [Camellia sinensis var. sinensis]
MIPNHPKGSGVVPEDVLPQNIAESHGPPGVVPPRPGFVDPNPFESECLGSLGLLNTLSSPGPTATSTDPTHLLQQAQTRLLSSSPRRLHSGLLKATDVLVFFNKLGAAAICTLIFIIASSNTADLAPLRLPQTSRPSHCRDLSCCSPLVFYFGSLTQPAHRSSISRTSADTDSSATPLLLLRLARSDTSSAAVSRLLLACGSVRSCPTRATTSSYDLRALCPTSVTSLLLPAATDQSWPRRPLNVVLACPTSF